LANAKQSPLEPQQRHKTVNRPVSLVRHAIRLLLEYPQLAQSLDIQSLQALELPGITMLIRLAELSTANAQITTGALLEYWRGTEEGGYLAKILELPLNLPEEGIHKEFQDTVGSLLNKGLEQRIDELLQKDFNQLTSDEKRELQQAFSVTKH
jgi:DNA primase